MKKYAATLFLFSYLLALPNMATTKKDRETLEEINYGLEEIYPELTPIEKTRALSDEDTSGSFEYQILDFSWLFESSEEDYRDENSSDVSSIDGYDDGYPVQDEYSSDDNLSADDYSEQVNDALGICPKEDGRDNYLRQQSSKRIYDAQRAATISLHALKKEIATLPRESRRYKKLHRLYNNYVRKLERIAAQNLIESSAKEEPLVVPADNPDQQRIHINHRQQWSGDFCTPRKKKQKSSKQRVRQEQPTILVANDAHFVPMPGRADAHLKPSKFDIIDAMFAVHMNALCGRGW